MAHVLRSFIRLVGSSTDVRLLSGCCPGGPMAGSSTDVRLPSPWRREQRAGPPWVQQLKKRMPRHRDADPEEDRFLAKEIPSGERWFQAEQTMLKQRNEGSLMKMSEAYDKIRRDLSVSRAAWYPQKWTSVVEGRPVQVHACIVP